MVYWQDAPLIVMQPNHEVIASQDGALLNHVSLSLHRFLLR